jgi:hypothetical protein
MPLLLKFKKDRIKSFQFGGVTNFYSTYTVKEAQQPKYNPGALLEAYSPMKAGAAEAAKEKPKEIKAPKIETAGFGHSNDNLYSQDLVKKELDKLYDMYEYDRPAVEIARQESNIATLQNILNTANKNFQDNTSKVRTEVIDKNEASQNFIYTNNDFNNIDGEFWVTHVKEENGKVIKQDKKVSATDYYIKLNENQKLLEENKSPKDYFVKNTYNEGFHKRETDSNYLQEQGNDFVTNILSGGLNPDKAVEELQKKFQNLGKEDVGKTITLLNKTEGKTSGTSEKDYSSDNIKELQAVLDSFGQHIDVKVQNALMARAWQSINTNELNDVIEKHKDDDEKVKKSNIKNELKNLVYTKYSNILQKVVDPKRQIKSVESDSLKELEDKQKLFADAGVGKSEKELAEEVADIIAGEKQNKNILYETIGINTASDVKREDDENSKNRLNINTTLAASLPVVKAIQAKRIVQGKYDKIVENNTDKNKEKREFTLSNLESSGLNDPGLANLDNAITADGFNLKKYLSNIAVDVNEPILITWMPMKVELDKDGQPTTNYETIFGEDPKTQKELQEYVKKFEQKQKDVLVKIKDKTLSEEGGNKELEDLNKEFSSKFSNWKMFPCWTIPTIIPESNKVFTDENGTGQTAEERKETSDYAKIMRVATKNLTSDEENLIRQNGDNPNLPIELYMDRMESSKTFSSVKFKRMAAFVPMPNYVMLNYLSNKNVFTNVYTAPGLLQESKGSQGLDMK